MALDTYRILRLPEVKSLTGLSTSSLYKQMDSGTFVRPVPLGGRAVGWPQRDVEAILEARIAGKGDSDVRELVAQLVARRSVAA